MKLKITKILLIVLLSFAYAPFLSAAEDVNWVTTKETIHENGAGTPVLGTRWAIASRREDIQITFRLEAQTDMKKGGWRGDIRALEKFYVLIYLVDENDNKNYLKVKNSKVIGPDTYLGRWKDGLTTSKQQMLTFDFSWDELISVKQSKSIILSYASYDSPDNKRDITFPLDEFNARLTETKSSIVNNGGQSYLMTQKEVYNTPILNLPSSMRDGWQAELQRVSNDLSKPIDELLKLSRNDIELLIKSKIKANNEARLAKIRKFHQAIYDQEPNWMDINICPKPDVGFCNNVGKNAYEIDNMFSNLTHEYGEILGVVWRSSGSIIRIYGGNVEYDLDPEIYRASKAKYYYIIKNDKGQIDIRPCKSIQTKF